MAARAMYMAMADFFGRGGPHIHYFNSKMEFNTRQWMVGIHCYFLETHMGDGYYRTLIG